jgi:hypothetical protein
MASPAERSEQPTKGHSAVVITPYWGTSGLILDAA